jgi:transcriptional regulator with XRE-family HTH domain
MKDGEMDRKRRLGYAIRRAREQRRLSPPQLADLIGVGRDTVNAWERGDSVPSMLHLGPLCAALMVDPRLFADLPEEPPSPVDQYLVDLADVQAATVRGIARGMEPKPPRRGAPRADEGSDA